MKNEELIKQYLEEVSKIFLKKTVKDVEYKHTYSINETDSNRLLFKEDLMTWYTIKDEETDLLLDCRYLHPISRWNKVYSIDVWKNNLPEEIEGKTVKKSFIINLERPYSMPELRISNMVHPESISGFEPVLKLFDHLEKLFSEELSNRLDRSWNESIKNIELSLSQIKSNGEKKE